MLRSFAALALLWLPLAAGAEDAVECPDGCIEPGTFEFGIAMGAGYAENPLVDGDDLKLPVLPRISYYGDHFFLENARLGYTLSESPTARLNLLARPNLDYLFFSKSGDFLATLNPPFPTPTNPDPISLKKRRLTYLGGLEASFFVGNWQIDVSTLLDISVGHDGYESDIAGKYVWQRGDHRLESAMGLKYRDQQLTDYYYGVDADETVAPRFTYSAEASWSPYVTLAYTYKLSDNLSWISLFAYQHLAQTIADSPLVNRRDIGAGFVGIAYDF